VNYRVQASESGKSSVDEQLKWYRADESHGGDDLAERWFNALYEALAKLAIRPASHGFAPENGRWLPEHEIRQMLFRPWKSGVGWRVLFTIDEELKLVTVLQVRHEHRRWMFQADAT
jgi:hypothetical protein